jgi:hypothetical protein
MKSIGQELVELLIFLATINILVGSFWGVGRCPVNPSKGETRATLLESNRTNR